MKKTDGKKDLASFAKVQKKDTLKKIASFSIKKTSLFILEAHGLNKSKVVDELLSDFIEKNNLSLKKR